MGKIKICLDAGHGGVDPGAVAQDGTKEKDMNLTITKAVSDILSLNESFEIILTRTTDVTLRLENRSQIANSKNADVFVSIHLNANDDKTSNGHDTFHYPKAVDGKSLAEEIHTSINALRLFKDRGVKDADFAVLRETKMTAALVEVCFISNPLDLAKAKESIKKIASSIAAGITNYCNKKYRIIPPSQTNNLTPLKGDTIATNQQMYLFLSKVLINPKIECPIASLVNCYREECAKEGLRADIALAQALHETNCFQYGGIVKPEQNNFAGLGAIDGNRAGQAETYSNYRIGVRAHVQHLKAYADTEPLKETCLDTRFKYVARGTAPYLEWLSIPNNPKGTGWASDKDYAQKIHNILKRMNDTVTTEPQQPTPASAPEWQVQALNALISYGIITTPEYWQNKLGDGITVGEMFAILSNTIAVLPKIISSKQEGREL